MHKRKLPQDKLLYFTAVHRRDRDYQRVVIVVVIAVEIVVVVVIVVVIVVEIVVFV